MESMKNSLKGEKNDVTMEESSINNGGENRKFAKFRVTIEPALFGGLMSAMMVYLTSQNLILDKACRANLNYSDEICDALAARDPNSTNSTVYKEAEDNVQILIATINQWKFFVDHVIPIAFCLVMGAWSDKHGRKPLLLSSQIGYLVGALSMLVNVYFEDWKAETMVISYGILHGLGGASVALNLATISYIGDISSPETKTQRMGLALIAFTMATPIGSAIAGPIYEAVGYFGAYGIAAGFNLFAILYITFFVAETRDTKQHRKTVIKDLFDLRQIIFSLNTLLRPRAGWLRGKLLTLVFLGFFVTFYYGEMSVTYLFTIRYFDFTYTQYGLYNTYRFVVNLLGMAFTLGFVSFFLGVSDPMVGIMGCFSQILASVCMFASPYFEDPWLIYLAPVIDFLNGAVTIVNKSMLTKSVPNHELGQISAVMSVVEAFVPVVANPVYSAVFKASVEKSELLPSGSVFLITAAVMVLCIVAFIFLYADYRSTARKEKSLPQVRLKSIIMIAE